MPPSPCASLVTSWCCLWAPDLLSCCHRKDIEKADMNTRLNWVGLLHRDKRTPGRFMMRLKVPNGITNADCFRFYADSVEK